MYYKKGTTVIHIKTQRKETVVGLCKMKINGNWVDGVIYEGLDYNTDMPTTFVKSKEEFDNEFILSDWYGN